jgi:3-oxoacyl-[acyl-carrier-protein] synthase II
MTLSAVGDERRAVITGIGPVTPIGTGMDAFWEGLRAQKSAIGKLTCFDTSPFRAKHAAEIADFEPSEYIPPHKLKRLDRYAQFAMVGAQLALKDAGFECSAACPPERVGVSFGSALSGISNAEHEHSRFLERGPKAVSRALALQVFGGSAHSNIAIEHGFSGIGTTNSNSCASGNVALGEAFRWIRAGLVDAAVAGAAESPLSPLTFCAFDNINTMSRWQGEPSEFACRPFDANRDGFVMGEGGCVFFVENASHAKKRGATIYAEIVGYSHNNEAYHMTSPRPDGEPVRRAMRLALEEARANPEEIGYINAHGSSTQLNDSNEAHSIRRVFGNRASSIPISGTKAYTGHPLGATGAMEAACCALAIARGFIPPTLHLHTPDPDVADLDLVPNEGREIQPRLCLNNAFGFGGINSCLVLGAFE